MRFAVRVLELVQGWFTIYLPTDSNGFYGSALVSHEKPKIDTKNRYSGGVPLQYGKVKVPPKR